MYFDIMKLLDYSQKIREMSSPLVIHNYFCAIIKRNNILSI